MLSIYNDIKQDWINVRKKIIKLTDIVYSTEEETEAQDIEMLLLHEQLSCLIEYEAKLYAILKYISEENKKSKPLLS